MQGNKIHFFPKMVEHLEELAVHSLEKMSTWDIQTSETLTQNLSGAYI